MTSKVTARASMVAALCVGLCAAGLVVPGRGAAHARPGAAETAKSEAGPVPGLPEGLTYVRSVEGVHEYRLANGLQVLLLPDTSAPKITVNVVYKVGSRHEVYGETGMAHLLEHLLFKGTPRHTSIPLEFKQHGATFNGTTDYDRTNYYETFPASEENLTWALELEADRMVNSFVARKDLDTEMTVVRNEFEIGESRPSRVLWQSVLAAMFQWHNYGKSVIGARSDIENVSIEHLQAFYRRYYQPDDAVLIVAGKIDPAATLAQVAKHFAAIPRPTRTLEPAYTVEPTQNGERAVSVRRTGEAPFVIVGYRIASAQHADTAALIVLSQILGKTPTGRLYKQLVENGKATSTAPWFFAGFDPGHAAFTSELRKQDSPQEVLDGVIAITEGIAKDPVTEAEVARVKAAVAAQYQNRAANSQAMALELTTSIADGDWRLLFWERDEIAKVTAADVQRAALAYFKRENRTAGIFYPTDAPDRAEIPPRLDAAVVLKDYKGGAAVSQGEDFDPSHANIDKRTVTKTLAGGLKLALLQKQTRGDRVEGHLTLHLGNAESLKGWGAAPSMLGQLLSRGTRRLSYGALSDELSRLQAQLGISGEGNYVAASFSTTRENLEPLLRLVAESLREPALLPDEFDQIKRARQRDFESALKTPQVLANNRIEVLFNSYPKDHPFYLGTLAEQSERLARVTLDDVKRFHGEFYGASAGELALVGSFDGEAVTRLITETLGTWTSAKPYERIAVAAADAAAVAETIEVPDQANAVFAARLNVKMRDSDADYPALAVANRIFGGGTMASRLGNRLRQKEGLSYGTGSNLTVPIVDDAGSFSITASYAPKGAARLEGAVCEELSTAIKDGFNEEELATAKESILSGSRVNRTSDAIVAATLDHNLHYGRTMHWGADLEGNISAVTLGQANAAFRRYIEPARLVAIKAGSFGAGGPGEGDAVRGAICGK